MGAGRWEILLFLIIATAFCFSTGGARARDLAPAQMIEAHLPAGKTLQTATQAKLLAAICEAVKEDRSAAVAITATAVVRRAEFAGEIVGTVLQCSEKVDCEFAGMIVAAAVAAAPQSTVAINDAAVARAPDCSETIRKAAQPVATPVASSAPAIPAPPGTAPGLPGEMQQDEGYDPLEPLRLVCDDGTQRAIRESQINDFLKTHPKSFLGTCPTTPTPQPTPAAKPAPTSKSQ